MPNYKEEGRNQKGRLGGGGERKGQKEISIEDEEEKLKKVRASFVKNGKTVGEQKQEEKQEYLFIFSVYCLSTEQFSVPKHQVCH